MGVPGVAVEGVDEGNFESAVRFLTEWVSDGEAEARRYLADHAEPPGSGTAAFRWSTSSPWPDHSGSPVPEHLRTVFSG